MYPVNISLWGFPLCNPLKRCLLIWISIIESPSVFFAPTLVAWERKGKCVIPACFLTRIHTLQSSFIVLMLRKPGLLCQRSLGQSCYADVLWSKVMKIGSCFDQSTCCVISVLLLPLWSPYGTCASCQSQISQIQMNTFSIWGWIGVAHSFSRTCPSNN